MKSNNVKTFCKKYKGVLVKGAVAVGTLAAVTFLVTMGFKKKTVETCGVDDLIAYD